MTAMKCQAAVLRGIGQDWEIAEITLDPPRQGEVLVKMAVAGVCHSDDHFATGDMIPTVALVGIMEATGATCRSTSPCSVATRAQAWSKRSVPACGR
jgi:S-(hydroxymethyl)glutathione dehydrogenase/alcohol dehydrogenase